VNHRQKSITVVVIIMAACFALSWAAGPLITTSAQEKGAAPLDIGSRLELFVDDYLIERISGGAELRMHHPVPREVAIVADAPWEGNNCGFITVFEDDDRYRMYYSGAELLYGNGYKWGHRHVYCYAESTDGIHWTKPELGLFEFDGSKQNNIVHDWGVGYGTVAFAPFLDTNPDCKPEAKYKALGNGGAKQPQWEGLPLYAFQSPDGIHWSLMSEEPVITKGKLDTQNLAFWDSVRGEYRAYTRDIRDGRDIRTCTSPDFVNWTEPVWLEYSPSRVSELYTNQIIPYYRAPHIFLGFPTRYIERDWTESHDHLPGLESRRIRAAALQRLGTALTDGMFMASHDGLRFRVWPESFIRPGLRTRGNWFYGNNYQSWGLVETKSAIEDAPREISVYVSEHQEHATIFRRHTLRVDGFVSVQAPLSGGELVTKPVVFEGRELVINYSTSAAGSVQVEVQDAEGNPIDGFALAQCREIFGDDIARVVSWEGGSDVSALAGRPVRLRFVLKDADLYSVRFRQ